MHRGVWDILWDDAAIRREQTSESNPVNDDVSRAAGDVDAASWSGGDISGGGA